MAGADATYDPVPWYTTAKNWISDKFDSLWDLDTKIAGAVVDKVAPQMLGPAGAVVSMARTANTTIKTLSGNAASGIRLPGTLWDGLLNVPDVDLSVAPPATTAGGGLFTDTLKQVDKTHAESLGSGFTLPLWGKVAITAAVVIGTVLIIKESFD